MAIPVKSVKSLCIYTQVRSESNPKWLKWTERIICWYHCPKNCNKPQTCYYRITWFHCLVDEFEKQLQTVEDLIFTGKRSFLSIKRKSPYHFFNIKTKFFSSFIKCEPETSSILPGELFLSVTGMWRTGKFDFAEDYHIVLTMQHHQRS